MNRARDLVPRCGAAVALALALDASPAAAQDDPWLRMVAESDSVGPTTPHWAPGRLVPCGAGVQTSDSVRVAGGSEEFLFAHRSMRTRGRFTYLDPPETGAGRFAVRRIGCHEERGHPYIFVLERDGRYFYLVFSLRERPAYGALAFRSGPDDDWRPFRWDPARRSFAPTRPAAEVPAERIRDAADSLVGTAFDCGVGRAPRWRSGRAPS